VIRAFLFSQQKVASESPKAAGQRESDGGRNIFVNCILMNQARTEAVLKFWTNSRNTRTHSEIELTSAMLTWINADHNSRNICLQQTDIIVIIINVLRAIRINLNRNKEDTVMRSRKIAFQIKLTSIFKKFSGTVQTWSQLRRLNFPQVL